MLRFFKGDELMKIIGLICEYNPFHYGHLYHINKIKEKYPDSLLILCLNGYFLQRGEISLLTKEDKVKIALNYGIDIVIELPCLFGTQSADFFALKSIELLKSLNTEIIIFGSESNNITYLEEIAKKELQLNNLDFQKINHQGLNYAQSIKSLLNIEHLEANDVLAISYLKANIILNAHIKMETIKRTNNYHDTTSNSLIISAKNIRKKLQDNCDVKDFLPKISYQSLKNINEEKYFYLLKYKILTDPNLTSYLDVKEGIENALKCHIKECNNIEELRCILKSKRYSINYLNRLFIHIFLGLTKTLAKENLTYIKILGYNDIGKKYLHDNKNNFALPIKIDKKSQVYNFELSASMLYDLINMTNTFSYEKQNKPIYINKAVLSKESIQK